MLKDSPTMGAIGRHLLTAVDELRAVRRAVDDLYLAAQHALEVLTPEDEATEKEIAAIATFYTAAVSSLRLIDIELETLRVRASRVPQ